MEMKPSTFSDNLNCHLDYANLDSNRLSNSELWEIWPTVKFKTDAKTLSLQHTVSHSLLFLSHSLSLSLLCNFTQYFQHAQSLIKDVISLSASSLNKLISLNDVLHLRVSSQYKACWENNLWPVL